MSSSGLSSVWESIREMDGKYKTVVKTVMMLCLAKFTNIRVLLSCGLIPFLYLLHVVFRRGDMDIFRTPESCFRYLNGLMLATERFLNNLVDSIPYILRLCLKLLPYSFIVVYISLISHAAYDILYSCNTEMVMPFLSAAIILIMVLNETVQDLAGEMNGFIWTALLIIGVLLLYAIITCLSWTNFVKFFSIAVLNFVVAIVSISLLVGTVFYFLAKFFGIL